MTDCFRGITFTIPGVGGSPGVLVSARENAGNIDFTIDVLDTATLIADLRGLFFHLDESFLTGLKITNTSALLTDIRIGANSIIDLGNGANMFGTVPQGFDLGLSSAQRA
jgi:hypothetical protein